jgi:hypothetical protein
MSNNPDNHKLSSQFGDITGPSESELIEIEQGGEDSWYTPERINAMRDDWAKVDANYGVVRNAQKGSRGTGTTDFGISRAVDRSAAATAESEHFIGSEGTGGGKNTGGSSDFDSADTHARYRAAGFAGMDVEAGPRASSFDVNRPRNAEESAARMQGETFLKVAGPTCNHPRCQAFRAKGMELWEQGLGRDRVLTKNDYAKSTVPHLAIPSTRTDVRVPPMNLRPGSENVPVGQRRLQYGLHDIETKKQRSDDTGDFVPGYGQETLVPKTVVMDTNHPRYKELMSYYKAAAKAGDHDIFHPDDWLEHHHAPGEEFAPLPWES